MLYKLSDTGKGLGALEPLSFLEVSDLQRREKDLEDLLADHLLDVLFEDTNRSYDEDAIWEMMEKARVAAYGDIKHVVEYLDPRDIVFFCHK